jgi:hypothetical protein
MIFKTSSDYLDENIKNEIRKAIEFLIDGGWKSKDEICERIAFDFEVSRGAVLDLFREIERKNNKSKNN